MNFQTLLNIVKKINTNRTPYTDLWRWALEFSGSLNTLKDSIELGQIIKGGESLPADNKSAISPAILNLFDTASNYYAGLFFPENKPFAGMPIDDEDDEYEELFDKINSAMYDGMKQKETNFNDSKSKSYGDYVVLGTKCLFAQQNPDEDYPFYISNYSVQNMGFNTVRDVFVFAYEWTADQIVRMLTDGIGSKSYMKLPDPIKQAYNDYDFDRTFALNRVLLKNRDYVKGAARNAEASYKWVGHWIVDGVQDVIMTEYFKERPHAESLYSVKTGEIYGRSPLIDRKNGFEIYDGVLYMITNNIAKIGDPATGYFDVGETGLEYDSTPGTMTPFNAGLTVGSAPTFKIQDAGDITPAVSYLEPRLYEALRIAYRIDAMVDLMTQKRAMTATEILTVEQLRNKMLAPMVRREVAETAPLKRRMFLLTARWLARQGKIEEKDVAGLEDGTIEWKIKENSAVERIIESEDMAQFNNELNVVAAATSVDADIGEGADIYDALETVLENGIIKLKPKREYQANKDQRKQLLLLQGLAGAGGSKNGNAVNGGGQPTSMPAM